MAQSICSFPNCGKPRACKGLCDGHYQQQRAGKPLTPLRVKSPNIPQGSVCTHGPCDEPQNSKGLCKHHARQAREGRPLTPPRSVGSKDDVGYLAAHWRVRKAKGKASAHLCVQCGGQAADWAYQYGCPNERSQIVNGSSVLFSLDVDYYEPMCKACHKRFDALR